MRSNTNTDLPYSCTLTTKLLKVRRRSYQPSPRSCYCQLTIEWK